MTKMGYLNRHNTIESLPKFCEIVDKLFRALYNGFCVKIVVSVARQFSAAAMHRFVMASGAGIWLRR